MKKNIPTLQALTFLMAMVLLFSSCFKDDCRRTYKVYTPVYKKLKDLRAEVQSRSTQPVTNTGKLYIKGDWIFLNEVKKGIHIIDNSDPTHPVKTSFINIPGNIDMHVKGNILYADLYSDLLAVDITDPAHINVTKYLTNAFPDKSSNPTTTNPDSISIITDWLSRDTTVDCTGSLGRDLCLNCSVFSATQFNSMSSGKASTTGMAGSMARFAAVSNYMYAVTSRDLNVIDISTEANPLFIKKQTIGWDIETIFPYNNKLYIGSGSSMSVYSLQNPASPSQLSWSGHWCSGDPVVADDNYAYVTLHEANVCGSKVNQLEIYDLSTPGTPALIKTYLLTNPQGLSKDGNLLFICDDGLKVYDASQAADIKLISHLPIAGSYDVIANNGIAYVVSKDGLYQYDYSNPQRIRLLSKLLK